MSTLYKHRHTIHVLILLVLIAGTMVALRPLQKRITQRMEELKSASIARIEAILGRSVEYDGISPSIFRYLEIRNLRIKGQKGERPVLLSVSRVKVYYSIMALFRGEPLDALTEIRVENSDLVLDSGTDQDVIRFLDQVLIHGPKVVPRDLTISGRNLQISYITPDERFWTSGLFFDLHLADPDMGIKLRTTAGVAPRGSGTISAASADIQLNGRINDLFSSANLTLELDRLDTDLLGLRNQTFNVVYEGTSVEVRKIRDRSPLDILVTTDLQSKEARLTFAAEKLKPADLVTLQGGLSVLSPWLEGSVSGKGEVTYAFAAGHFSYNVNLSGDVTSPPLGEPLQYSAALSGTEKRMAVSRLRVAAQRGYAAYSGSVDLKRMYPSGALSFRNFVYGNMPPLSAQFSIGEQDGQLTLSSPEVNYAGSTIYNVGVNATLLTHGVNFHGSLFFDLQHEQEISFGGTYGQSSDGNKDALQAEVTVRRLDLSGPGTVIGRFIGQTEGGKGLASATAGYILDARLSLSAGADFMEVDAPYVSLFDIDHPETFLSFSATGNRSGFAVENLVAGAAGYSGNGRVTATVGANNSISFDANLGVNGIEYQLGGIYVPGQRLVLTGKHGFDARVTATRSDNLIFSARADQIPLPGRGEDSALSFNVDGMFDTVRSWNLAIHQARIAGFGIGKGNGSLEVEGRVGSSGGTISRLKYADGVSAVNGSGSVDFPAQGGTAVQLAAALADPNRSERYVIDASYGAQGIDLRLEFTNSPIRRFLPPPLRGGANGVFSVQGSVSQPTIGVQVAVPEGLFNTDRFSAEGELVLSDSTVRIQNVSLQYLTNRVEEGKGTLDLGGGTASLSAVYQKTTGKNPVSLSLAASVQFATIGPLSISDIGRAGFDAEATVDGISLRGTQEPPWDFSIKRTSEAVTFSGGPEDAITGTLSSSGAFRVTSAQPLPLRFTAEGKLNQGQLEANLTRVEVAIQQLPGLFDLGQVTLLDGTIRGGLRIVGPVNDPDFYGTLTADAMQFRTTYVADEVGPAKAFLVFQEKTLDINRFAAPSGEGTGYITGRMVLNRWSPEEYRLEIETDPDIGVHVTQNFSGVVVDGYGIGNLTIQGTPGTIDVSGDITARSTDITLGKNLGEKQNESNNAVATVDLRIHSGRRVEFLWPTSDFPVIRAIAENGQGIHITASSENDTFSLTGDVGIQGGEIYYFDRSFYIRSGEIKFNENERSFDPRISARAEIREVTNEGPVKIYLIADESRLSQFQPRFESSPPLSSTEIVALLGGNIFTGSASDVVNLSSAVLLTSDVVTQFGVINSFENKVRDALGLDLFSVRTHVFQNLVVGAIDQANYPLDNTSPSLGKYLDNTTVFLGKYLGSDLFLELLLELRSANPFDAQVQSFGGLEVDSEIGLEWQTPFFLLTWSFFPRTPESLFVTDNSVEFSWEISY